MRNAIAATKVKMSGSAKKSEQEHIQHSSIKRQRVCRKFLEVSSCSRARQRKKLKSTKKCVARAKLFLAN